MAQNGPGCGRANPGGGMCGWCGAKENNQKPYRPKSGEHWGGKPPKTDPKKR